jgi:hypothetical protein
MQPATPKIADSLAEVVSQLVGHEFENPAHDQNPHEGLYARGNVSMRQICDGARGRDGETHPDERIDGAQDTWSPRRSIRGGIL